MSTPISRVSRLLNEGARFMVKLPGQEAIDLTPDVMAALNEVQSRLYEFGPRKVDSNRGRWDEHQARKRKLK